MSFPIIKRALTWFRDFFASASKLDGNGERVEIFFKKNINFNKLDMYQKSHYRRYQFAASIISKGLTGDFACGTGYGTLLLSEKCEQVIGADINENVVKKISLRYKKANNVKFIHADILNLDYASYFDCIVSFETIEHFDDEKISGLFNFFYKALKPGGQLIFSTPYIQHRSPEAINMGFHLTFNIDENKIKRWLSNAGLTYETFKYQNYQTHTIEDSLDAKDFIICVARRK